MSPPERERRPGGGGASSRGREGKAKRSTRYTPGEPDAEYDAAAIDLVGHTSDHLAADHWGAICLAAERGELSEVET